MSGDVSGLTAALADRYKIEREIGAGGMATVFLASDIRHHRKVAVKVLNPELGAVLGAERFLSEIRVTANLQHPNLLPLFDSGEVNGLLFYVMPFVEGETLRARLDREKQLPIDEAVHISTAIAGALDYAHRHGVIHRDLKPENILLHDGQPLIADFGIALAVSNAGGARVTQTGLSLGTPQYMSPEQATGDRGIDGRTDIYSLGALTYEMLAGEAPHTGTNAQAIIAKLMTEEPRPISVQRRSVPEHVERAVECALQKLPADRFATAKDFSDALNGKSGALPTSASHARRTSARRRTSPALVAGVAAVAAAAGAFGGSALRSAPTPGASVEFTLKATGAGAFEATQGRSAAFSPDGRAVAYTGAGDATGSIVLRQLDTEQPRVLPGTRGASDLFFSPDGKRLAFYRSSKIFVVATDGTPAAELAYIGEWNGLTWANDRTIVYEVSDTLWAIDASNASKRVLTVADRAANEADISTPFGMPDGKTVSFVVSREARAVGVNNLAFISLDGSKRTVTSIVGRSTLGYIDGWLLFSSAHGGGVNAIRFALSTRSTNGDAIRLADSSSVPSSFATTLSSHGDLAYVTASRNRVLAVLGPRGEDVAVLNDLPGVTYPAWSPDGKRVAFTMTVAGTARAGLYIFDPKAGTSARLATTTAASRPAWSPDGKRIAFIQSQIGVQAVRVVPADGSATDSIVFTPANSPSGAREVEFTPDGRSLVVTVNDGSAATKRDIVLVPLDGSKSTTLAGTAADENQPSVSRDGQWLAYMSDESGRPEVYVQAMKGATGNAIVSRGGGSAPRWTGDGHVLYLGASGTLLRVELATVGGLPAAGKTDSLFYPRVFRVDLHQDYDVTADGRYAVVRNGQSGADVVIVTNWWERNRARLPR